MREALVPQFPKSYSPDEPLLRTGELRESISHEAHAIPAPIILAF